MGNTIKQKVGRAALIFVLFLIMTAATSSDNARRRAVPHMPSLEALQAENNRLLDTIIQNEIRNQTLAAQDAAYRPSNR